MDVGDQNILWLPVLFYPMLEGVSRRSGTMADPYQGFSLEVETPCVEPEVMTNYLIYPLGGDGMLFRSGGGGSFTSTRSRVGRNRQHRRGRNP